MPAITAYNEKEVMRDAINDTHIYKFIVKPFDPDKLRRDVQDAVESFHQQELKKFKDDIMEKNAKIAELEKQLEDLKASIKN